MLKQLKTNRNHSSGFTMIELAVALAIAGVLMYFAIPAYSEFSQRQAMTNETNDLLSDLGFARSLAIENGNTVTVTSRSLSGNATWTNGWHIRETLANGRTSIVRSKTIISNNVSITSATRTVSYNSIGALTTPTTVNFNIQITPDFPNFLSVSVLPSGLASSNRDAYGSH